MASTYTSRTKLEKQATGENPLVWGVKLNNDLDRIDFATKGVCSFTLSGSATLTSSNTSTDPAQYQALASILHISSGTGGTVTVPSLEGRWLIINNASGSVTLSNGSNSVSVSAGARTEVATDGTLMWKLSVDNSTDLPVQTGQSGKLMGTDGTDLSWVEDFELGSETNVASATTCDIGTPGKMKVAITGTTTITSFGTAAKKLRYVRFAAALTLTHNATSLILPGGASITTAANDRFEAMSLGSGNWLVTSYTKATFTSDGSGNWRCRVYSKANGNAVIPEFVTASYVMADDTAVTLPIGASAAIVAIVSTATISTSINGEYHVRAAGAAGVVAMCQADPTGVNFTTGALTGMTGTDGKSTLSADTSGNLYIENRTGASRSLAVTIVCRR
jgi:hypothetical protein